MLREAGHVRLGRQPHAVVVPGQTVPNIPMAAGNTTTSATTTRGSDGVDIDHPKTLFATAPNPPPTLHPTAVNPALTQPAPNG